MPEHPSTGARKHSRRTTREGLLLLVALLFGLLLLPILVYAVGQVVFGTFAGGNLWTFFASLHGMLRNGNLFVWFLVLSPYLILQTLRISFRLFKNSARQA